MRNRSVAFVAVVGGLLVSAGFAQSPAALEGAFEGAYVVLKMDMPGDTDGVDVWPGREFPVDFRKVGDRLRNYGVALRKGDSVMVTKVRVKKKLIEFQLGGGGYSGAEGAEYIPTSVPKSKREKELDDLIKKETDERRKERLKSEQSKLRDERHREEARLRAEAAQAEELAKMRERGMRADSGSRFNLRFDGPVPDAFLRPERLAAALAEYVDFESDGADAEPPLTSSVTPPPVSAFPLSKGMRVADVEALFGRPTARATETAAGLEVERHVHELAEATLTVRYVDGVLVKYALESR